MKRLFLLCLLYCLLRLQIYEAIVAIFWQSASYVFAGNHPRVILDFFGFTLESYQETKYESLFSLIRFIYLIAAIVF